MVLRFANFMFEPIWNREHIDHVQITAAETSASNSAAGSTTRPALCATWSRTICFNCSRMMTMEAPNSFHADAIRAEKAKVIEAIRRLSPEEALKNVVRGQYVAGFIGGEKVAAYRDAHNVDPRSLTETYIALKLWIDNWRWMDVPFYIRPARP